MLGRTEIRLRPLTAVDDGLWPAHMHPVLRRVYAGRGIASPDALDHRLARLEPPHALGGLERATELLTLAIRERQRVLVVGDYDADGATGVALALRGLRALGAEALDFEVPNRITQGYGLSESLVDTLIARRPDLIITVDNGIASHAGVARARAAGIAVIVTDHHLPAATLPAADAIVNPNLAGDHFPSKALAGVGVMFYLLLALRARLRDVAWFGSQRQEPDLAALTDLVALGTVADMVALDRNNRILVAAGLKRIRAGRAQPGIRALLRVAGRDASVCTANDLGFAVGPRVNAAGRLDDMRLGIACLLADDEDEATAIAARLDAINAERRELQQDMSARAAELARHWYAQQGELPAGLVLFDAQWHPGVVGLVASRLKDALNRPVFAFAPAKPGSEELRGSGRSVAGFNLRDALVAIDVRRPGLIARFGGHAMAAGLTLAHERFAEFAREFAAVAEAALGGAAGAAVGLSDGSLAGECIDIDLVEQLRDGGPWGQAFSEPAFDDVFDLIGARIVGERHWRLDLRFSSGGLPVEAMHFGGVVEGEPPPRLRALYQLMLDEWRGERRVRLNIRYREPA